METNKELIEMIGNLDINDAQGLANLKKTVERIEMQNNITIQNFKEKMTKLGVEGIDYEKLEADQEYRDQLVSEAQEKAQKYSKQFQEEKQRLVDFLEGRTTTVSTSPSQQLLSDSLAENERTQNVGEVAITQENREVISLADELG